VVRLDSNISALEKKDNEHSDLAMETAKKIVEQLQLAMDIVDGKLTLTFKTRLTDPYLPITKP